MEEPDDDFLKFFLLNMCTPKIMALLAPVHFMFIQEILVGTRTFHVYARNSCWYPYILCSYENFLLVPVHFMFIQEILVGTRTFYVHMRNSYRGFCFKKNFSSYSFVEAALTMRFCWI